ncbi:hypothetical protein [Exiguobacterium acetylicum]|uniref:hypothetical protein n=1 Tax=Exiguobacterium acetylicum TaxID=41170 RepID=UPI001EE2AD96|nr:hypothetical protein [Exiguobacterium acetylicum]UKS57048.1 hypothetical protein K6T22_05365 [Exiguobacterium acetylicum]
MYFNDYEDWIEEEAEALFCLHEESLIREATSYSQFTAYVEEALLEPLLLKLRWLGETEEEEILEHADAIVWENATGNSEASLRRDVLRRVVRRDFTAHILEHLAPMLEAKQTAYEVELEKLQLAHAEQMEEVQQHEQQIELGPPPEKIKKWWYLKEKEVSRSFTEEERMALQTQQQQLEEELKRLEQQQREAEANLERLDSLHHL